MDSNPCRRILPINERLRIYLTILHMALVLVAHPAWHVKTRSETSAKRRALGPASAHHAFMNQKIMPNSPIR